MNYADCHNCRHELIRLKMYRNFLALTLITCLLSLNLVLPVAAQQLTMPNIQETPAPKQGLAAGPKSILGAVSGVAVGVPVNISKSMVKFTIQMQDSISQNFSFADEPDFYAKSIGAILAVPYGVLGGIAYGTIKGFENGIIKGSEKPFSKASFSMKEE